VGQDPPALVSTLPTSSSTATTAATPARC